MERKHGPWTIRSSREVYASELVTLREDEVTRPDGSSGRYATVRLKDGVSVLAVDDEGRAYFAREFRYAIGRESTEAVGGGIEEGETPEQAAHRELREELGIEAAELVGLGSIQPVTALVNSSSTLFLARRLTFREKRGGDRSERIEIVRMPLAEAVARSLSGEIFHPTTCVAVLRAQHYLKRERSGNP